MHVASVFDICVVKGAELDDKDPVWFSRVELCSMDFG